MSIQRAEELKREWTDKFVKVRGGVPELRRFEGLVGTVKTVNMNCRLLIEFDTPADISWYDIDPMFVLNVDPEEAKAIAETSKAVEPAANKPPTKPASPAKDKSTSSTSPLDAIRAASAEAKPAAATSPLDAIRAASAETKPAAATSPLDAIRAASAETKPAAATSPLDAIRAASADAKPAAATTPLDAIRAQSSSGSSEGALKTNDAPSTPASSTSSIDASSAINRPAAMAAEPTDTSEPEDTAGAHNAASTIAAVTATTGTGGGAAAAASATTSVEAASANKPAAESQSLSAAADKSDLVDAGDSLPISLLSSTGKADVAATTDAGSIKLSALDQVRDQANSDSLVGRGNASIQQTLFDQVKQQTINDDVHSAIDESLPETDPITEKTTDSVKTEHSTDVSKLSTDNSLTDDSATSFADEPSMTGVEDPVKQTFKGKKLPKQDDLKIVEGIGPKIEELFHADGIKTWHQLSVADPDRLKKILENAGPRFRMHNPETWPQQAGLAFQGQWQQLEKLQDELDGGRPPE